MSASEKQESSPPVDSQADESSRPNGFTAVNGAGGRSPPQTNGTSTPKEPATTAPAEEPHSRSNPPAPPKSSTASQSVSPTTTGTPANAPRNETPASLESPPNRKRSYPEAFGEPEARAYYTKAPESEKRNEIPNGLDSYASNHQEQSEIASDSDRRRHLASDFDPHANVPHPYYPAPPAAPASNDTERRLVEALQHDSEDPHAHSADYGSGPDDDLGSQTAYGEYSTSRSGVQVDADRKRRKRVFSNRTKTGCMTCRKRKKKCDEQKPECNNCLRGGFVCEGYSVRNTWQKPSPAKPPVPLQSKTGLSSDGAYPSPTPYRSSTQVDPQYGAMSKDIKPHDDGRRLSPPTLDRAPGPWPSQPTYGGPAAPPTGSKYSDGRPVGAHDDPHELAEQQAAYPPMNAPQHHHHHAPPQAPPSAAHPHATAHGPPVTPAQHGAPPPPGPPTLPNPVHASQSPVSSKRAPPAYMSELSERDKMLRGEYYLPYTPALLADRDQCATALWRFNNAALNPSVGIGHVDRMGLFRAIMNLRPTADPDAPRPGPHDPPPDPNFVPNGGVGARSIVEAPFHCDYGYNITVGQDVVIGADCRITDTCAVSIGDNVVLSPKVTMVCATYAIDPRERRKGQGRALGRNIVVEDNAWIGANVTILPGVRVGRCSTVGAGSLLHKDVPPFTVVAGNPPRVVRGIYDDGRT